jgi:ubiquinone/menaquinone biosynthesis C-methylase UbiE
VYLYFASDLTRAGFFDESALAATTERHHLELVAPRLEVVADASAELSRSTAEGVVFALSSGLPSRRHLQLIAQVLRAGRPAWVFWPAAQAVECVDDERLQSLRRLCRRVAWLRRIGQPIDLALIRWHRVPTALRWIYRGEFPVRRSDILVKLTLLTMRAQPVSFANAAGVGLYLRTDYWNGGPDDQRMSGLAKALVSITERVVCLTPRHDELLDRSGAQQIVMDSPRLSAGEDAIVLAPTHYAPIVKAACQALRPVYLYDRGAAAQSVGAELSQLLGIPYVFEYRGAGAVVHEALKGAAPFYPELYSEAEELALRQATVIVAVGSSTLKDELIARGIDASRVLVAPDDTAAIGSQLQNFAAAQRMGEERAVSIETGDAYKDQVQNQWNQNPVGSQHARESQPHTLDWFLEVERHRYGVYAPWMPDVMEFAKHAGRDVLEIGGGMGTDLAQFARNGARVTDIDLAAGHLRLAEENFRLRGLSGRFTHHDAESLPFDDRSFDIVYSNGVLHHTPNTAAVVGEIHRVLRPGGRAIVMLYAENSLHYWRKLVWRLGVKDGLLDQVSMGEIMSRQVERSANESRPLVKVYTKPRAARLFRNFECVEILQRQLQPQELPSGLKWTVSTTERLLGWNLIIKARKPQ